MLNVTTTNTSDDWQAARKGDLEAITTQIRDFTTQLVSSLTRDMFTTSDKFICVWMSIRDAAAAAPTPAEARTVAQTMAADLEMARLHLVEPLEWMTNLSPAGLYEESHFDCWEHTRLSRQEFVVHMLAHAMQFFLCNLEVMELGCFGDEFWTRLRRSIDGPCTSYVTRSC